MLGLPFPSPSPNTPGGLSLANLPRIGIAVLHLVDRSAEVFDVGTRHIDLFSNREACDFHSGASIVDVCLLGIDRETVVTNDGY